MTKRKAALILVVLAIVGWAALLIIPFLDLSVKSKAFAWTASLVAAESFFLIAAMLIGKEAVHEIRRRIFRRPPKDKP